MRVPQFIALTGLVLLGVLATAHATEKRVALVVGNAAYRHADKLTNPVNDARGMRDALKHLGFEVIYGEDLDLKGLVRAIEGFAGRVQDAEVAIVYFSGHGATFGDTPYVVPVDAEFASLGQVPYELVSVEKLIGEMRPAKGVRIAILDACRDNGAERELKRVKGVGVTRGLAPMKDASGLIIAYATQYGATAADDAGGGIVGGLFSWMRSSNHSPFTAALLDNIAAPGLDVKDVFLKVGRDVVAATEGKQRPEISISIYEQYALVPGANTGGGSSISPLPSGPLADEAAWSIVNDTKDAKQLRRFIALYPASARRPEAETQLKVLEQTLGLMPSPAPAALRPQQQQYDAAEIAQMVKKGAELMANGNVAGARLMYQRLAAAGEAAAAFALAETYDPLLAAKLGTGILPDTGLAQTWYAKAKDLGSPAAAERLERLARMRD